MPWYRGNGQDIGSLTCLRTSKAPFHSLNFPDAPNVGDPEASMNGVAG